MSLYDFANQKINTAKICKIAPVVAKNINGRTKYFFLVHLSGNTTESIYYNTEAAANSVRDALIAEG